MPRPRKAKLIPTNQNELKLIIILKDTGDEIGRSAVTATEASEILGVTRTRLHQLVLDDVVIPAAVWNAQYLFFEDDVQRVRDTRKWNRTASRRALEEQVAS